MTGNSEVTAIPILGFWIIDHRGMIPSCSRVWSQTNAYSSKLRHADIGTTLGIYTHAISRDKLTAQKSSGGSHAEARVGELRSRNHGLITG
jgi:hypothetical protein